jgi:hypothetical protein
MREVIYAGGSFITSDAVADALLDYAAQLANADRAAALSVPALDQFGQPFEVSVVVGPASQLMAEPVANSAPEPEAAEFLADLERRITELRRIWPSAPYDPIEWEL